MKRFISFLLSFIVLLSCFIVPVNAEVIDTADTGYYIRRGIYSFDSSQNGYKYVSATTLYPSDLWSSPLSYEISNSFGINPNKKYFFYYNFTKDDELLIASGNDARIDLVGLTDFLYDADVNVKIFNPSNTDNITCGYIDKNGNSVSLDNTCVQYSFDSASSTYSLIVNVPYQDVDISTVWVRLYFTLEKGFNYSSSSFSPTGLNSLVADNGYFRLDISKGDKNTGLISGLLNIAQSIWDWIVNFFSNLGNLLTDLKNGITAALDTVKTGITTALDNVKSAITNTIEKIQTWLTDLGNSILNGLKTLFIPSDNYFQVKFNNLYETLVNKLGVIALPFTVIKGLFEMFTSIGNGDGIINFPNWSIFGVTLINSGSLNVKELINGCRDTISSMTDIDFVGLYYTFVDAILWIGFINLCRKKFSNITLGGSE